MINPKIIVYGGAFLIGAGWGLLCDKVILPALGYDDYAKPDAVRYVPEAAATDAERLERIEEELADDA